MCAKVRREHEETTEGLLVCVGVSYLLHRLSDERKITKNRLRIHFRNISGYRETSATAAKE